MGHRVAVPADWHHGVLVLLDPVPIAIQLLPVVPVENQAGEHGDDEQPRITKKAASTR